MGHRCIQLAAFAFVGEVACEDYKVDRGIACELLDIFDQLANEDGLLAQSVTTLVQIRDVQDTDPHARTGGGKWRRLGYGIGHEDLLPDITYGDDAAWPVEWRKECTIERFGLSAVDH
jgi:hypothetical protein